MKHIYQRFGWRVAGCLVVMLLLAGCPSTAEEPPPIPPTRTPLPTFTPTPQGPVVDVAATDAAATAAAAVPPTPAPTNTSAEPPPPTQPAATPTPDAATATTSQAINVRGGPGTTYAIIGAAQPGTVFTIKGKDPTGTWWQVDYQGRDGWLFGQLVTAQNTGAVAVAQNIPAPPPPTATQPPPPPPPTQAPAAQPTQPPAPSTKYKFNIVVVSKCERQPSGNWIDGTTYVGGQPANGYKVVFSYAPDGPPATEPMISGPHPGYPGWKPGFYSHIIRAAGTGAIAGDWYVWIVDDAGQRISEIGKWTSTGPGEGCNMVVVDFDSR